MYIQESSCGLWLALGVLTKHHICKKICQDFIHLKIVQKELISYSVIKVNMEVASGSTALLILQCDTGLKEKKRKN